MASDRPSIQSLLGAAVLSTALLTAGAARAQAPGLTPNELTYTEAGFSLTGLAPANLSYDFRFYEIPNTAGTFLDQYYWSGTTVRRINGSSLSDQPTVAGNQSFQTAGEFGFVANGAGTLPIVAGRRVNIADTDLYRFVMFLEIPSSLNLNPNGSSYPTELVSTGGRLFCLATDDQATAERDLFSVSDAGSGLTVQEKLTTFGETTGGVASITSITPVGNRVYFVVKRPGTGTPINLELWRSDGTGAGTAFVRRIDGYGVASGDAEARTWWGGRFLQTKEEGGRLRQGTGAQAFNSQSQTIEMWIRPNRVGGTQTIFERAKSISETWTQIDLVDGRVVARWRPDIPFTFLDSITSNATLNANEWTHVAVVFSAAGTSALYINGVTDQTFNTGGALSSDTANQQLYLGSRIDASQPYWGGIDELRIWSTERTGSDIASEFRRTFLAPAPAGLLAQFSFDNMVGSEQEFPAPTAVTSLGTVPFSLTPLAYPELKSHIEIVHVPGSDKLYFAGFSPANGVEPWYYDIGSNTASLLVDVSPGQDSSFPHSFTALANDEVAFATAPPAATAQVRTTVGQTAGTSTIFTNNPTQGLRGTGELARYGDSLMFVGDDPSSGNRTMYRWNGSAVESLPSTRTFGDADPREPIAIGDTVYFSAQDDSGRASIYRYQAGCVPIVTVPGDVVGLSTPRPTKFTERYGRLLYRRYRTGPSEMLIARVDTGDRHFSADVACADGAVKFEEPSGLGFNPRFGERITGVGDVNGDGYEDMLISAPGADRVYLSLGTENPSGALAEYITLVAPNGGGAGTALSGAGDFNGDGLADFIVGAPGANTGGFADRGEAYVVFGSKTRFAPGTVLSLGDSSGGRGLVIRGFNGTGGRVSLSVAGIGNLNGDVNPSTGYGQDDILIGAPGLDNAFGNAFLIYGNRNAPATINLSQLGAAGTRIRAQSTTNPNGFGTSVAGVGDVNGDGVPDMVIGSSNSAPVANHYLLYGKKSGFGSSFDISAAGAASDRVELQLDGAPSSQLATDSQMVAPAGDLNGDGLADFVVRHPFNPTFDAFGRVYVVYGSFDRIGFNGVLPIGNLGDINGDGNQDQSFYRGRSGGNERFFGQSVAAAGDLNGDGFGDLLIGSNLLPDPNASQPYLTSVRGYVVYGGPTPPSTTIVPEVSNLDVVAQMRTLSEPLGTSAEVPFHSAPVAAAGDVNGDGLSDFAFGGSFPQLSGSQTFANLFFGQEKAPEATYIGYIPSGLNGVELVDVPETGIGASGDGRFSVPLSRVSFRFKGGGSSLGQTLPSRHQVTIRRQAPPIPNPSWIPAPVHWQIQSDRESTSIAPAGSTIVFKLTEAELAGLDVNKLAFFRTADDPPSASSVWTPISAVYDQTRGTFSISRTHNPGTMSLALNGAYALFQINEEYELGEEIQQPQVVKDAIAAGQLTIFDPQVTPEGAAFWHAGTKRLYATSPAQPVEIVWRTNDQTVIAAQIVNTVWPDESKLQLHVSGTPPVDMTDGGRFQTVRLMATDLNNPAAVDKTKLESERVFVADGVNGTRTGEGRSFVLFALDTDPRTSPIFFLPIRTVAWNNTAYGFDKPATVGDAVEEPTLHTHTAVGPFMFFEREYYNAGANYHDRSARTGPIVPVNEDLDSTTPDDNLVVAYYQKSPRLLKAFEQQIVPSDLSFGYTAVRYDAQFDPAAPKIVIASLAGSGPLDPLGTQMTIYVQNDRTKPGFNPNEEHALILSNTAYALRDDLNVIGSTNLAANPNTSEPYVLVQFLNPQGKRAMKAIRVLATEPGVDFAYTGTAGTRIQAPVPLSVISPAEPCPNTVAAPGTPNGSHLVSGEGFVDRNGELWAIAGDVNAQPGISNPPVPIVYRYFYVTLPGFYDPAATPQELSPGTCLPWLDKRAGTPGTPIDITYNIVWPDNPPVLTFGETLIVPKNGLPDIAGRLSTEILWDQSVELGGDPSALFYDPLEERRAPLASIPNGIKTEQQGSFLVFPDLSPALKPRLRYDTVTSELVFRGFYVTENTPEDYVLPNVLTERERTYLKTEFSTAGSWGTAIDQFPGPANSGEPELVGSLPAQVKALTSTTRGGGYMVLLFENDGTVPPATPVVMSVIRVECPLYRGSLHAIEPDCAFDEKLTIRHTADIGGFTDNYEFQWAFQPDADGIQPPEPVGEPGGGDDNWLLIPAAQLTPTTGIGACDFTIRGSGLLTLSDNWFVARYRRVGGGVCNGDWSPWTPAQLGEGWIKRVLGKIDPFKQRAVGGGIQSAEDRFFAFQNAQINTIVSMLSQAGRRYSGDVALNCSNLDAYGLIEIYTTVLNRGKALSVDGIPPVDYAPANNALLLAASRIADLYLLLGNEAYADAQDPTIGIGSESESFGAVATSIHAFMNQTSSLMGEELSLLRGRDDRLAPGVEVAPVFNRLFWNFTRDITGGEVAYALNYNIKDASGLVDGVINASDAERLYPQGHGDAWGHYLTAIKTYYRLLREPNYTWVPRAEAVTVSGSPVSVDYFDERKFANIAAAKARTGAEIVSLTYRAAFTENPDGQYKGYKDNDPQRAWGLSEWGSRAGEAAYLDWVVTNAILPDIDPVGEGIQKIDRTTVAEIGDIAAAMSDIQAQVDKADAGLNPLGLSKNVVLFDIDPTQIVSTFGVAEPHFERVYNKAVSTLSNAKVAFDYANAATQALRSQADDIADFQQSVEESESDFNSRLIEIFGYPYGNDIGPGGSYPAGYNGPDFLHWMYADDLGGTTVDSSKQITVNVTLNDFVYDDEGNFEVDDSGNPKKEEKQVAYTFSINSPRLEKPAAWTSPRRAPGELQLASSDLLQAKIELSKAVEEYSLLVREIEDRTDLLEQKIDLFDEKVTIREGLLGAKAGLNATIIALKTFELAARTANESAKEAAEAAGEAVPQSTIGGLAVGGDFLSAVRGALAAIGNIAAGALGAAGDIAEVSGLVAEIAKESLEEGLELRIEILEQNFELENDRIELELLFRQEPGKRLEIFQQHEAVRQAASRVAQALAAGERILEDRARFRRNTAAAVQDYRYKDMAFRIFRNDALQKYRAQFDLAAQYAYLAATAYDYETNLLPGDPAQPGSTYMTNIVRSRSLGVIVDGTPQIGGTSGDPGIASALARMKTNWDLNLKTRLGFNNPDLEGNLFSLRSELYRIPQDEAFDEEWRQVLLAAAEAGADFQSDPDVRRFALPIPGAQDIEPGFVFKFPTTINFGQNVFGFALGEGDAGYDPTATTTKVRRHAIVFTGYNDVGLSTTPRTFFFPAGTDILRSPTGAQGRTREWRIVEQLIPVPFPLTEVDLGAENFIPRIDNLTGEYGAIRRFGLARAFDEEDFEPSDPASPNGIGYTTDLVSRSVWNSNWVLVIPAGTLLGDRQEAVRRFIYGIDGNGGVKDVKVFFESFAFQTFGLLQGGTAEPTEDWLEPPVDFIAPAAGTIRKEVR